MKFTLNQKDFAAILARTAPFCEPRSPIPVLACVKLTAEHGELSVSATDMDAAITETVAAEISEPGTRCVRGDRLKSLVASLRSGAVTASEENGRLKIQAAQTVARFDVWPAQDYPQMPGPEKPARVSIKAGELDRVLAMTIPSISGDRDRHYLNGLFLHATERGLVAVSTDGHRGAMCRPQHDGDQPPPFEGVLIPRVTCNRLRNLLKGETKLVEFMIGEAKVTIRSGAWLLTTKLIDGTFPDYERWFAPLVKNPVVLDGEELSAILDRVEAATDPDSAALRMRGVRLEFDGATAKLRGGIAGGAGVNDEMPMQYSGDPVEVGLNARYLRDSLAVLGEGEVELHVRDPMSPVRVCRRGDTEEGVTVMAYRI